MKKDSGFTLVELLMSVAILAVVITGLLRLFIYTSVAAEVAGNKTLAVSEAQNKLEEIRNDTYDNIATDYASGGSPGKTFDLSRLTGKGVVTVDTSVTDRLTIDVVVCWRDKYNRIIGEDTNLNGTLDVGEDLDGDGKISSIIKLATMISKKQ